MNAGGGYCVGLLCYVGVPFRINMVIFYEKIIDIFDISVHHALFHRCILFWNNSDSILPFSYTSPSGIKNSSWKIKQNRFASLVFLSFLNFFSILYVYFLLNVHYSYAVYLSQYSSRFAIAVVEGRFDFLCTCNFHFSRN